MEQDDVGGENSEIFRQEFVRVRHRTGLSQLDFAPYLGICGDYVQKIESGERNAGREVVLAFLKVIDSHGRTLLLSRLHAPHTERLPLPAPNAVSDAASHHESRTFHEN